MRRRAPREDGDLFITLPTLEVRTGAALYDERGAGPPLVLLHAHGFDRTSYDAIAPALRERFRTIRLDWPGMAESPAPASPRDVSAGLLADVLADAVAALELDRVLLVGTSVGGFASARLAAPTGARARVMLVNRKRCVNSTWRSEALARRLPGCQRRTCEVS